MMHVYEQLRAAAQRQLEAERVGYTLSATALVHEAYLKLAGPRKRDWENRAHFYAAAAEAMRRILIDRGRARAAAKRGGDRGRIDLEAAATLCARPEDDPVDFVALDKAVSRLECRDQRMAKVARLRFYVGLSIAETAEVLGVSERTVKNDWSFAKAWLARELREDE